MKKKKLKLKRKYKTALMIILCYTIIALLTQLLCYRIEQVQDKQPEAIHLIP